MPFAFLYILILIIQSSYESNNPPGHIAPSISPFLIPFAISPYVVYDVFPTDVNVLSVCNTKLVPVVDKKE